MPYLAPLGAAATQSAFGWRNCKATLRSYRPKDSKCTLTRRLFQVCLTAKMSFRPFSLDICRASVAGLVFLACIGVSRAGDMSPQSIEIVPLHGTAINTNLDQLQPSETRDFEVLSPRAPRPFQAPVPPGRGIPMPPPQANAPSERERDLLDRRKNWVFMTPEDMMAPDAETDLSNSPGEKDGVDKKPTTAMQRYYQHLFDSDRQTATKQVGKADPGSWATNSATVDNSRSSDSPFNTSPDPGIFQPARADSFSGLFGSDADTTQQPSPEAVRLQEEQKAHMDSFKQLWDIDQPTAAAASATTPAPIVSAPLFGASQSAAPAFDAFSSPAPALSGRPNNDATAAPTMTSTRNIRPPHSDFTPPQRAF